MYLESLNKGFGGVKLSVSGDVRITPSKRPVQHSE